MINPRNFHPTEHGGVSGNAKHGIEMYQSFYGRQLSTYDKHYASMSNTLRPGETPQAAGSKNRGSVQYFGEGSAMAGG